MILMSQGCWEIEWYVMYVGIPAPVAGTQLAFSQCWFLLLVDTLHAIHTPLTLLT